MTEDKEDTLTLKWGTLKAWRFVSDEAQKVAKDVDTRGLSWSMSAAAQDMTPAHKQAVCDLIDAVNCEEIWNDWTGEKMSKDEAKKYVMESQS